MPWQVGPRCSKVLICSRHNVFYCSSNSSGSHLTVRRAGNLAIQVRRHTPSVRFEARGRTRDEQLVEMLQYRVSMERPSHVPNLRREKELLCVDTMASATFRAGFRSVANIIHPYPNLSAWYYSYEFWVNSVVKLIEFRERQQQLAALRGFSFREALAVDFKALEAGIKREYTTSWGKPRHGWRMVNVTIGVPVNIAKTHRQRLDAAKLRRHVERRAEPGENEPAPHPVDGTPACPLGASPTRRRVHLWRAIHFPCISAGRSQAQGESRG
jgi:hypothetical protein